MPLYLVVGPLRPYDEEDLTAILQTPRDPDGVRHGPAFFSEESDRLWAVHDAPDEAALRHHLARAGYPAEAYYPVRRAGD